MLEGLGWGEAVLGVQRQAALQEVAEGGQPARVLLELLVLAQQIEEFPLGRDGDLHLLGDYGLGVGVVVLVEEAVLLVEVTFGVEALLEHLDAEAPAALHHQLQHLVVAASLKQEVTGEELVETAAHGPSVHCVPLLS